MLNQIYSSYDKWYDNKNKVAKQIEKAAKDTKVRETRTGRETTLDLSRTDRARKRDLKIETKGKKKRDTNSKPGPKPKSQKLDQEIKN